MNCKSEKEALRMRLRDDVAAMVEGSFQRILFLKIFSKDKIVVHVTHCV